MICVIAIICNLQALIMIDSFAPQGVRFRSHDKTHTGRGSYLVKNFAPNSRYFWYEVWILPQNSGEDQKTKKIFIAVW